MRVLGSPVARWTTWVVTSATCASPGEQTVAGQRTGDADRPLFVATMPLAHLDGVGRTGLGGEEERDIGIDGGLVFLSRST